MKQERECESFSLSLSLGDCCLKVTSAHLQWSVYALIWGEGNEGRGGETRIRVFNATPIMINF